jgi:hypothetical protein
MTAKCKLNEQNPSYSLRTQICPTLALRSQWKLPKMLSVLKVDMKKEE